MKRKILKEYSDYPHSGVYCLFNLYNDKYYIGSSINISKRVWEHFNTLTKQTHHNRHLQRAYNKYPNYFIGFVLEDVLRAEDLLTKEQYWIDRLDATNHSVAYNICPIAGSSLGVKHSEETRKKLSNLKKGENHYNYGKHLPESTRSKISDWHKGKVVSEATKEKLSAVNTGKRLSEATKSKISESLKKVEWSDEHKNQVRQLNAKQVFRYDLNGILLDTWESAAECARQLGFNRHFITRVCRGERQTYKGFKWSYLEL